MRTVHSMSYSIEMRKPLSLRWNLGNWESSTNFQLDLFIYMYLFYPMEIIVSNF